MTTDYFVAGYLGMPEYSAGPIIRDRGPVARGRRVSIGGSAAGRNFLSPARTHIGLGVGGGDACARQSLNKPARLKQLNVARAVASAAYSRHHTTHKHNWSEILVVCKN
ncbi:hypothetical protein EVAR_17267_1 [Eumeta japonica]|uniref:Uncharacterized protein n=1 Tax=Eumeta variegata TaxID=151549 RepID=A0A4C1TSZ8_EUMVA|nr:hypothetical protein EVAR_17267_1 [Eumeta japonica]